MGSYLRPRINHEVITVLDHPAMTMTTISIPLTGRLCGISNSITTLGTSVIMDPAILSDHSSYSFDLSCW